MAGERRRRKGGAGAKRRKAAGPRAPDLVADWVERRIRGAPAPTAEWLRAHPGEAAELEAALETVRRLGQVLPAERWAAPPQRIASYAIVREIGRGGMGVVFEATDASGARVAVKVLRDDSEADESLRERFLREAEVGRRVRHPNVVSCLDAGEAEADGRTFPYLVLEHVEGRTLLELLEEGGSQPEALCRHAGREIAHGLAAIHAAGAVHRDVKPANVLVTSDHRVKVTDLGVALLERAAGRLSRAGAFVGSLPYGAPEQFGRGGGEIDARADLHGLGLTLYELATGVCPFRADDAWTVIDRVLHEIPRRAGELNPQISPFFEDLLARLLEKDPAKRPSSAADVAEILDRGEESAWWRTRAAEIEAATKRPLRRMRVPRETSLHGREADLGRLRDAWEKAKRGEGAVVLVEGEAGIGKSRLVDEFVALLEREGEDPNFLFGSYPPGGASTAGGAFSTAYREHFGAAGSGPHLTECSLLVPPFDALLRGETPPPGAEPLPKDALQTCFVRATQSLARERPTIVLIDDLHFAPLEGRGLFASVALATPGHRVLLVGTTRPGADESWAANLDRIGLVRMPLARLGPKDLVRVLAESLQSDHLAEELGARIAVKSDGNPFFVFEILRALREGQFVTRRADGTWIRTKDIREIEVPSTVTDLVQARVSALGIEDRNLLEVASCLGFSFDAETVAAVLRLDLIPALQRLGQIERAHRLVRSVGLGFEFDHHHVAEVLYAGLSAALRAAYHAAIAEEIEARSGAGAADPGGADGAVCVELTEHLVRSSFPERAARHLGPALQHLRRTGVPGRELGLIDRVLERGRPGAPHEVCDLLLRKADVCRRLGRPDVERAALSEALRSAEESNDASRLARTLAAWGSHLGRLAEFDEARRMLDRARELARRAADADAEAAVLEGTGLVLHMTGRHAEAQHEAEAQLSLARRMRDRRREASALGNLASAQFAQGRFAEADSMYAAQLALARALDDRSVEARALGGLGRVSRVAGRWTEARRIFESQRATARAVGDRREEALAISGLANVCVGLGLVGEGIELQERRIRLAREMGDRTGEATGLGNLALAQECARRYADARATHRRAWDLARHVGDRSGEMIGHMHLGSLLVRMGRAAEARTHLDPALRMARELGARYQLGYVLESLAAVREMEDDLTGAAELLEESLRIRRAIGHGPGVISVLVELGAIRMRYAHAAHARTALAEAADLADDQEDWSNGALARALLAELGAGDVQAVTDRIRRAGDEDENLGRAWFHLWRATRDVAHLAESKRHLDTLVEHAPPEYRESMLTNVRLHREIVAAAKAEGL